jgi:hypothetical protein
MRKLHALWMALFAVLSLGVIASPAFAEETQPLWLWQGMDIETGVQLLVEITGLLLLNDKGIATEGVHCEGSFDGWVGANGEDEITEVLNTLRELVAGLEPGQGLILCETDPAGPCMSGHEIDIETVGLPWMTLLELVGGLYMDDFTSLSTEKLVGWMATCLTLLGETLDSCTAELVSAEIMNEPETTLMLFNQENVLTCTLGGAMLGDVIGEGLIVHVGGGAITVSQP